MRMRRLLRRVLLRVVGLRLGLRMGLVGLLGLGLRMGLLRLGVQRRRRREGFERSAALLDEVERRTERGERGRHG